jgi:thiamine biosynthesis protein ThiI
VLKEYSGLRFEDRGIRYYIHLNGNDPAGIIEKLKKIPGIFSFSLVQKTNSNIEDIKKLALDIMTEEMKDVTIGKTFKIETQRGDKNFSLTSPEITQEVGRHLFRNIPNLKADMYHPDLMLSIDVRVEGTFIFTKVESGLGGLPSGILGKGLLMISGGIDSPVSGYLALKKGIDVEAIHFASPPYTSRQAEQKVIDLLEIISAYSYHQSVTLHVIPFTAIQEAIYKNCQIDYGITIMRRMMYRIAEKVASDVQALAIINGESVGQVASQTLDSMNVINRVIQLPVIRPVATMDKQEIIQISREIKTFETSIKPFEDCCTVFVPKHPQTKPKLEDSVAEENKIPYETLITEAINNRRIYKCSASQHTNLFDNEAEFKEIF